MERNKMSKHTRVKPDQPRYASFLVRVRQEPEGTGSHASPWRGSVENIQSGQKKHFTDPEELLHFIRQMSQELGISWNEREYIA